MENKILNAKMAIKEKNALSLRNILKEPDLLSNKYKDFMDLIRECVEYDFADGLKEIKHYSIKNQDKNYFWGGEVDLAVYSETPVSQSSYFHKINCLKYLTQESSIRQLYQCILISLSTEYHEGSNRGDGIGDARVDCVSYILKKYMHQTGQNKNDSKLKSYTVNIVAGIFETKDNKLIEKMMDLFGEGLVGIAIINSFPERARINGSIDLDILYEFTETVKFDKAFSNIESYWKLVKDKKNVPGEIKNFIPKITSDYRFFKYIPNLYVAENKKAIKSGIDVKIKNKPKIKKI